MTRPQTIKRSRASLLLCAAAACFAMFSQACTEDNNTTPPISRCDLGDRCVELDMPKGEDQPGKMDMDMGSAPDQPASLQIPTGCNPIAFEYDCMLPFPSDYFLVDDPSLPGKKRVQLTNRAKPLARSTPIDILALNPSDGYSPLMPILAHFPQGVDTTNITFHDQDLDATTKPTSTTLLIDTKEKKLVAHWAEIDRNTDDEAQRALIVRPIARLEEQRRYIVAFQGLKDIKGQDISAPEGFRHLRDKLVGDDGSELGALSKRYEAEIFPLLDELGIARDGLVLAWDFTTKTNEHAQRNLFKIRQELIQRYEATPPTVAVTKVEEFTKEQNENIALRLEGTIEVPLYVDSDKAGAKLNYDEQGLVIAKGVAAVPFTLQVPHSAMPTEDSFTPARIMQYGHGFFGAREEINYSFMRGFSNERAFITASVDWWGMSEDDIGGLTTALVNDPNNAFAFTDRVHQAIANQLALSYALKGPIHELEQLKRFEKPLFDAEHLYYYGISQGHIFGATFVPLSPHIDRAVFSVGGVSYSFMMSRSRNFAPFLTILKRSFTSPVDLQKFMAMSQSAFDRVDPVLYTEHLISSSLPNSPAKRKILMQIGEGDAQVNNLATYIQARSSGVPLLTPSPVQVWGLPTVTSPAPESALVVASFGIDPLPGYYSQTPKDETPAHEGVRKTGPLKEQLDQFLRPDGQINHLCQDTCNPD